MSARIHPTAIVEADVSLGPGTSVWDHVHLRRGATVGADCILGGKTYVAYGVRIGDRCKLNSFVYVCNGVTLETGVFVGAGTIFTNDRFPRAASADLSALRASEPDEHTLPTLVKEGATIGAGCLVGCGLAIGRFAMVGMGSVVTKSIGDFLLVVGNPARPVGTVCRCGEPTSRFPAGPVPDAERLVCSACGRAYAARGGIVAELPS